VYHVVFVLFVGVFVGNGGSDGLRCVHCIVYALHAL